jgi:GPH family glycoside/pentoside/hexuronide:cation symporter
MGNFSVTLLTWILMTGIFYYIDYVVIVDLTYFIRAWWILPILGVAITIVVKIILYELDHIQEKSPRKFLLIALVVLGFGFGLLFFFGRTFEYALWAFVLIGLGYIMANITVSPLMGDVMDYDEILTGTRREGAYAGLNAIITKPAISVANWAFLGIIDAFGFDRTLSINERQSERAINGILFSLGIVPMIFTIIAFIGMLGYKLHGKEWQKQKAKLEEVHIKKEREYMKHLFEKESLGHFDPDFFADLEKSQ